MATLTTSYQLIGTGGTQSFNGTSARIDLYAKYNSQSIANNNTNWSIEARLITSNGYIGEYTGTTLNLSGDGISSSQSCGTGNFTSKTLGSASGTIGHNSDGTKSISASASIKFSAWNKTLTVSGSATLPTIPRYASITEFTVFKVNETTLQGKWNASASCDASWYSLDNGVTWKSAQWPTFNITGLSANTTYNVKLRVRRADSQLTTDSNNVSQTTYQYPYVISMTQNNLTIGNSQKLMLYNPLNRTVTIKMYKNAKGGTLLYSGTGSGTSYTFTPNKNTLYASIPNETEAYAIYSTTYNNVEIATLPNNQKYSINPDECKPIFNDFEYEDTDNTILSLTNNNQILVNGNSDCLFKISTSNKATGQYSATITKYICYWGNSSEEVTYSSSSDVSKTICDSTGGTLKVTAVDSRGLTTTVTKTISYISYTNATITNLETQRKDGVDAKTFLKGKFSIFNGSWNASSEETSINRLKYAGYSVYINNAWSEYYDITSEVLNKATVSTNGNIKTYEFDFDDEIELHANGTSGGFTVGTEYQIKLLIKDGNSTAIFTPYSYQAISNTNVTDGYVAYSLHKDTSGKYHLGINCMSNDDYMVVANDKGIVDNNGNLVLKNSLLDLVYPVGSIYMSWNSTNPSTLFGGTWERMTGGFIYGCVSASGTGNGTGTTTNSHTLTVEQIPSHSHTIKSGYGDTTADQYDSYRYEMWGDISNGWKSGNLGTGSTGGGKGHSHKIPYMAVYIWKRTK